MPAGAHSFFYSNTIKFDHFCPRTNFLDGGTGGGARSDPAAPTARARLLHTGRPGQRLGLHSEPGRVLDRCPAGSHAKAGVVCPDLRVKVRADRGPRDPRGPRAVRARARARSLARTPARSLARTVNAHGNGCSSCGAA